jgi:hypothetical protein
MRSSRSVRFYLRHSGRTTTEEIYDEMLAVSAYPDSIGVLTVIPAAGDACQRHRRTFLDGVPMR